MQNPKNFPSQFMEKTFSKLESSQLQVSIILQSYSSHNKMFTVPLLLALFMAALSFLSYPFSLTRLLKESNNTAFINLCQIVFPTADVRKLSPYFLCFHVYPCFFLMKFNTASDLTLPVSSCCLLCH